MTKKVRIENADTSEYKVRVKVYERRSAGPKDDVLVEEHLLAYPTAMTPDSLYLTSTRYFVVEEA